MKKNLLLIFCLIIISGCSLFSAIKYVPLNNVSSAKVLSSFSKRVASKFEMSTSVIFGYHFIKMSSLGVAKIDEPAQSFDLVGFSPLGVKMAEVHFKNEAVTGDFSFKHLAPGVNVPEVIAKDFKRVYFHILPSKEAVVRQEKYRLVFSEPYEDGRLDYVFAGQDKYLIERLFYRDNRLIWQVQYFDYKEFSGKIFPMIVVLRNHKYKYKIIANIKEVK